MNTRTDPRQDRIFQTIQIVFLLDILLGIGLAAAGRWVLEEPTIAWTGIGLAIVGFVLLLFFRFLGRRASERGF